MTGNNRCSDGGEVCPRESRIANLLIGASCWLLMFLCFSLPNRTAPLSAGSLDPIALMKLTTRAVVFISLFCLVLRRWSRPSSLSVYIALGPLGLFVFWAMISTAWSPLKAVSFGQSSGLLVLFMLAVAVGLVCRDQTQVSGFLKILVIGLLVFCGGVLLINRIDPVLGRLSREDPGLFHPTTAGAASSLGILLTLCSALILKFRWARSLIWTVLIVDSALLLLSTNRTATFLTILFCGMFVVTFAGLLRGAMLAAGIVIVVLVLLLPAFQTTPFRFQEIVGGYFTRDQDLSSLSGRTELWTALWEESMKSPFIGHGYFVSSEAGEFYFWHKWANWTAHNLLLQVLVTTGILGVLFLGAGVLWPLILLTLYRSENPFLSQLLLAVCVLALWYSGWGVFNESFLGPIQPESVVFFTLAGIVAGSLPHGSIRYARRGCSPQGDMAVCDTTGSTAAAGKWKSR